MPDIRASGTSHPSWGVSLQGSSAASKTGPATKCSSRARIEVGVGAGRSPYPAPKTQSRPADGSLPLTVGKGKASPSVSIEDWTYGQKASAPSLDPATNPGNGEVSYECKAKNDPDDPYKATAPTEGRLLHAAHDGGRDRPLR